MRPERRFFRLLPLLAVLLLIGGGPAWAAPPSDGDAPPPAGGAGAKKKAHKATGKKAPKAKAGPESKVAHAKASRAGKQKSPSTINESIELTPFPSQAGATKKALAQNRRDQLEDAEKVARGAEQNDRWQTVLFHLRNLDARSDSEGCFWRLVAYYRMGQIERARALRGGCDFVPKDAALIEAEDEQAASLQPPTTVADKEPPAPVANPAPYTGAAPARVDR
jgi:hypothetical protein